MADERPNFIPIMTGQQRGDRPSIAGTPPRKPAPHGGTPTQPR